jgi:hypothetical protein
VTGRHTIALYNGLVIAQLTLPVHTRRAFDRIAADLRRVFGDRFVALVASGPRASLAFARTVTAGDIQAMSALTDVWHRDDLETPLLITPDEFQRSLDIFPVEYQAVLDRHVVVAGDPPFAGVTVDPHHLRRACEVQAKSHLIHLRQGWMTAAGHDDRLADLIAESAEPLRALLADVARLYGVTGEDAPAAGARAAALDAGLVQQVIALGAHPERAHHLVPRLPDYLAASEQLWAFVDTWTS